MRTYCNTENIKKQLEIGGLSNKEMNKGLTQAESSQV